MNSKGQYERSTTLGHYIRFLTKWKGSMSKEKITVILSPHIDDAFLSLCSFIESGKVGRNILSLNVFTLSDSRIKTNTETGFSAIVSTSIERELEELEFAKYLTSKGINYIPVFLGMKDAIIDTYYNYITGKGINSLPKILRGRARSIHRSFAQKRMRELKLKELIDSFLTQFKSNVDLLLAPIGIGDHIDHMMLRKYAESLGKSLKLGLYADIPYTYQYGIMSDEGLKTNLPKGVFKLQSQNFDPKKKDRLFRLIYKSQYDSNSSKAFKSISKNGGEKIFWVK